MDDYERYGDYNGAEDDEEKAPRSGFGRFLLILTGVLIAAVLALLIARIILFEHYPRSVRRMLPTDAAVAAYEEKGKGLTVYKQKLRYPYDDCDLDTLNSNDLGTFFADYVTVVPETGELQTALRLNTAVYEKLAPAFGLETMTDEDLPRLTFHLEDETGRAYAETARTTDSLLMYRYFRVAFAGIDFGEPGDGTTGPRWLRVVVGYEGCDKPYSYLLVYENNDANSSFSHYRVSKGELSR